MANSNDKYNDYDLSNEIIKSLAIAVFSNMLSVNGQNTMYSSEGDRKEKHI